MVAFLAVVVRLTEDALRWLGLLCRSTKSLEVENLFLRRQLALYIASEAFDDPLAPGRLEIALANEVSARSAADPDRTS